MPRGILHLFGFLVNPLIYLCFEWELSHTIAGLHEMREFFRMREEKGGIFGNESQCWKNFEVTGSSRGRYCEF